MGISEIIEKEMDMLDLKDLRDIMKDASQQSNGIFSSISPDEIVNKLINGQKLFDNEQIMKSILDVFLSEVKGGIMMGVEIVGICIIMGLLKNMSDPFGEKTVSSLATVVCGALIIGLCINNFADTYDSCVNVMNTMTKTMGILLPILIPLLISMGGLSSGGILDPVITGAITVFNTVMIKVVMPMVFTSTVFTLINGLTEKDYVKKLAVFIRKAAVFITGFIVTIFAGLSAVQGLVTKSADGLLVNTARYSMDNFIPIVGSFASDSVDMVLSCLGVIKNGIGIIGIVIILSLLIVPVIKTVAVAVIYKIAAIIVEPMGNESISDSLNEMGNAVITMAVVIGLSALMFLIFITIIIGIGGGTLWK